MTEEKRLLVVGWNDDKQQPRRRPKEQKIELPPLNVYYDDLGYIFDQIAKYVNKEDITIATDEYRFPGPQPLPGFYGRRPMKEAEIRTFHWVAFHIYLNCWAASIRYDANDDSQIAVAKLIEERLSKRVRKPARMLLKLRLSILEHWDTVFVTFCFGPDVAKRDDLAGNGGDGGLCLRCSLRALAPVVTL